MAYIQILYRTCTYRNKLLIRGGSRNKKFGKSSSKISFLQDVIDLSESSPLDNTEVYLPERNKNSSNSVVSDW